ncbi:unnamed protein product [Cunninghamella blakesleeana]
MSEQTPVEATQPIVEQPTQPTVEETKPTVEEPTEETAKAADGNTTFWSRVSSIPLVNSVSNPVNKHILTATGSLENIVDKWLPAQEQQQEREVSSSEKKDAEEEVAIARLYNLANNVKGRLQQRFSQQIEQIPKSKAEVLSIAETNQLLKETVDRIQTINAQIQEWVSKNNELAKNSVQGVRENIKGGYEAAQTAANQRIHDLTVELFHHLDIASNILKEQSTKLPASLQTHLEPLANFAGHEYNIIRTEVLKEDITPLQKATNILQLSNAYIVPFIQNSVDGIQDQLKYYSTFAPIIGNKAANDNAEPAAESTIKA